MKEILFEGFPGSAAVLEQLIEEHQLEQKTESEIETTIKGVQ